MRPVDEEQWKIVQTKTFTKWINSQLEKKGYPTITNLFTDVSNGVPLIHLMMALGVAEIKYNPNPKSRIAKAENVSFVLDAVRAKRVQLVNIGATDIVDADKKLILGLIWTIISRISISESISPEYTSLREELLRWVRKVTQTYHNVDVRNFTSSWKDGLAFNALIHRFRPELVEYDKLTGENGFKNCESAFNIARDSLDIPKLLDPEDVSDAPIPDEKSIITYVSQFYQKFKTLEREIENRLALSRFVKGYLKSASLRSDYERRAKLLLDKKQAIQMAMAKAAAAYEDICASLKECEELNSTAIGEYVQLVGLLGEINDMGRVHGFTEYNPPAELAPSAIETGYYSAGVDVTSLDKILEGFGNREAQAILEAREQSAVLMDGEDKRAQIAKLNTLSTKLDAMVLTGRSKIHAHGMLRTAVNAKRASVHSFIEHGQQVAQAVDGARKMFKTATKGHSTVSLGEARRILAALRLDDEDVSGENSELLTEEDLVRIVEAKASHSFSAAKLKRLFEELGRDGELDVAQLCPELQSGMRLQYAAVSGALRDN